MGKVMYGRNDSTLEQTVDGIKVIKKILVGTQKDKFRRINNIIKFDEFLNDGLNINSPKLISYDKSDFSVMHKWIDNSINLEDLLNEDVDYFSKYINDAMFIISQINNLPLQNKNNISVDPVHSPLIALTVEEYSHSTGAELELFSIIQHDSKLIKALSCRSKNVQQGYHHGDLRLDQFLVDNKGNLYIIDLEEFNVGDVWLDLAGFIGSILFSSLLKTFSTSSSDANTDKEIDYSFMERGKNNLSEIKPLLIKSIDSYSSYTNRAIDLENLAIDIGWFVIERVISRSKFTFRLSEVDKAIAGVGRQAIVYPETINNLFK
ncbi:phosphotransferase [Bombilactobacillus thymidiniphilus]|uniref:Phosphotransferase n=1 Tax=Bombilactobacillus thymidiniphilus TaxID=2923363 RepID=A0ABY4PFP0_9LACO|nr:phosphotransferase [Bombilactobacillus thymidiniphilus]UQS84132.1 phosphotransferase [Bombilactobacillus thymidiniphilus]